MSNEAEIYLKINGKQVSEDILERLYYFEVEFDIDLLAYMKMMFQNNDFFVSEKGDFKEGSEISFKWGYKGNLSELYTFTIKKIKGLKSFCVVAFDKGHEQAGKSKARIFKNVSYSDIARRIAIEEGYEANIQESGQAYPHIPQSNETNMKFLKRLAEEINFECFLSGKELHFHSIDFSAQPIINLEYNIGSIGTLFDFLPEEGTLGLPSQVTMTGIDPFEKKVFEVNANNNLTERVNLGGATLLAEGIAGIKKFNPGETGIRIPTTLPKPNKAKEVADNKFKSIEKALIKGKAKFDGVGFIKAGNIVNFSGIGERYSGKYFVKKIKHIINNKAYTCESLVSKNAVSKLSGGVEVSPPVTVINTLKPTLNLIKPRIAMPVINLQTGDFIKDKLGQVIKKII